VIPHQISLEHDQYQTVREVFHARLGDFEFEAALAEGRTMNVQQAVNEALTSLVSKPVGGFPE
jgi:hypothetical protein